MSPVLLCAATPEHPNKINLRVIAVAIAIAVEPTASFVQLPSNAASNSL